MISAIVAVDNNWGIGFNGDLLERIPEDLRYFKEITENNWIVMGRKTWDSLPKKPLPNRPHLVITNNPMSYEDMDEEVEEAVDDANPGTGGGNSVEFTENELKQLELEKNLLPGVRERAVKTALNIVSRARSERENKVTIEKLEDGCNVTFEIESLGETMLSLTLNVADVLQAEQLRDGFLDDPGALYSDIIDRLIGMK